jgi:hypothetical protein
MFLNLLSLCIKPMAWKLWNSFLQVAIKNCMIHIQMHFCFTFSFNKYTFKLKSLLNNIK